MVLFSLTEEEYTYLRSQNVTSKYWSRREPIFTLCIYRTGSSNAFIVLHTSVAAGMSIQIMNAFVSSMRHYIIEHKDVYQSLHHVGEKIFSMSRLEDVFMKETLMQYVFHEI